MDLSWTERYPDPAALRREVECMATAFVDALFAKVPKAEVVGIYFKGSGQKAWDTPLDYVPELSDVDLHVLFNDDGAVDRYLGSPEQAIELGATAEAAYFAAVPAPLHVPRVQLIVLNEIRAVVDFIPTPRAAVTVLHGRPYEEDAEVDFDVAKTLDAKRLAGEAESLTRFPLRVVDKPGQYLRDVLRLIVWRVSPTVPRALYLSGVPFADAWTANRTRMVAMLEDLGERDFAARYFQFYLNGWDYFLSGYRDYDAARRALLAGVGVIARGVEIGERWISSSA